MQTFFRWLTQLFPIWSVLVAVVALFWPNAFAWCTGALIRLGLCFIMLGMGLTLTLADFRRVFEIPFALLSGIGLQFFVMPLLGWIIGYWMKLPNDMAVGLVLVACCPGGTASNVVAFLARANVALSVSMTAISTALAVVLTPLLTKFYVGERVPVNAFELLQSILSIVILPVAIGIAINHFFRRAAKRIASVSPFISVLFIILIVGYILSLNRDSILKNWQILVAATLVLHAVGFSLGYGLAQWLKLDELSCRTVSIEVGMQNSGLGVELAKTHFTALTAVPCAVSAVMHCLFGSMVAAICRLLPPKLNNNKQ